MSVEGRERSVLPRRSRVGLFLVALLAPIYFDQGGGWNQNTRFDLTRAIVETGRSTIDPYRANTGDEALRDGHYYCDKAPGISWLALPGYALAKAFWFPDGQPSPLELTFAARAATILAVGIPHALGVVALPEVLFAIGASPWNAVLLSLFFALATPALPYSTLLYGHATCAAFLLLAVLSALRRRPVWTGLWLGLATTVEYPAALLGVPIVALFLPRIRGLVALGWSYLVASVPLLAYHAVVFGAPWRTPYAFSTQPHRAMGFFMGMGPPSWESIYQLTVGPYRGLFHSAPWLALLAVALIVGFRRTWPDGSDGRKLWRVALAVVGIGFGIAVSLVDWQGGWAVTARHLVPTLPFQVVLLAPLFERISGVARGLVWTLVGYSLLAMLAITVVRPEIPLQVERPMQTIWEGFMAGRFAQSRQSVLDKFPTDSSLGASNLGHDLGLWDPWSIAPLLLLWVGCVFGVLRGLRSPSRGSMEKDG